MENKEFVDWLNGNLEERGWLAAELARRSGVSQSQISLVTSGQRNPGPEFCRDVALAFGEDPTHIFRMVGYLPAAPPVTDLDAQVCAAFRAIPDDDLRNAVARVLFGLVGEAAEHAPTAPSRSGQAALTEGQELDARAVWEEVVFEMEYCGQLLLEGWTDRAEGERHFLALQQGLLRIFWAFMGQEDQGWTSDYTQRLLNAYRRWKGTEQHGEERHKTPTNTNQV